MRQRIGRKNRFAQISNGALQDKRLSLEARGLLAFMLSFPEEWEFSMDWLQRETDSGKDRMQRMCRELKTAGYLVREASKQPDGTFSGWTWWVDDIPAETNADPDDGSTVSRETRQSDNQSDGKASREYKYFQNPNTLEPKYYPPTPQAQDGFAPEGWGGEEKETNQTGHSLTHSLDVTIPPLNGASVSKEPTPLPPSRVAAPVTSPEPKLDTPPAGIPNQSSDAKEPGSVSQSGGFDLTPEQARAEMADRNGGRKSRERLKIEAEEGILRKLRTEGDMELVYAYTDLKRIVPSVGWVNMNLVLWEKARVMNGSFVPAIRDALAAIAAWPECKYPASVLLKKIDEAREVHIKPTQPDIQPDEWVVYKGQREQVQFVVGSTLELYNGQSVRRSSVTRLN